MSGGLYALGAATNLISGLFTNSANAEQNSKNRKLALYMFNTQLDESYQRTVADMKKAGINPMLAIGNGANSASANVPSNIPMQDPLPDLANVINSAAAVEKTAAETRLLDEQALKIRQDITASNANIKNQIGQLDLQNRQLEQRISEFENTKADSAVARKKIIEEINVLKDQIKTNYYQRGVLQQQINQIDAKHFRDRYGDRLGSLSSLVNDAIQGLYDSGRSITDGVSSAISSSYFQKLKDSHIQNFKNEIKHWKTAPERYQKMYHKFRNSFKSNRRYYRGSSRYLHQSDFR